ncbi:hypothetical protein E2C01_036206 [Portunus trituberculatus]|uniref:Uncharacterized protein n=1 Tax=Portunus trituberculatus TaxID=210409 RepID=A0A5B7FBV0_PORTR|nr:hypothetical protein [Portunus trituberculatus]
MERDEELDTCGWRDQHHQGSFVEGFMTSASSDAFNRVEVQHASLASWSRRLPGRDQPGTLATTGLASSSYSSSFPFSSSPSSSSCFFASFAAASTSVIPPASNISHLPASFSSSSTSLFHLFHTCIFFLNPHSSFLRLAHHGSTSPLLPVMHLQPSLNFTTLASTTSSTISTTTTFFHHHNYHHHHHHHHLYSSSIYNLIALSPSPLPPLCFL